MKMLKKPATNKASAFSTFLSYSLRLAVRTLAPHAGHLSYEPQATDVATSTLPSTFMLLCAWAS